MAERPARVSSSFFFIFFLFFFFFFFYFFFFFSFVDDWAPAASLPLSRPAIIADERNGTRKKNLIVLPPDAFDASLFFSLFASFFSRHVSPLLFFSQIFFIGRDRNRN